MSTDTLTDAVMRMRRELPGWRLKLDIKYDQYVLRLLPPPLSDEFGLVSSGKDNDWQRSATMLIDSAIKEINGLYER